MNKKKMIRLLLLLLVAMLALSACDANDNGDLTQNVPLDEPVTGETVDEAPLDEPMVDETVGEEPLDEEPMEEDPLGDEPMDEEPMEEEPMTEPMTPASDIGFGEFGVTGVDRGMMLASTLLDKSIDSVDGDDFADIDDLLLDAESGQILLAQVEHGGFLDIGDEEIALPLSALSWNEADEEFTISVDESIFDTWTERDADWPNVTDPAWDDDIVNFWQNAGVDVFWDANTQWDSVVWVSDLIGYGIDFEADTQLGSVDDLIVDLSQSRAKYVLLAFDPGLFDAELRAVPFSAFDASLQPDNVLTIEPTIGLDELTAVPAITAAEFGAASIFDETIDNDLDAYWEESGYSVASDADFADMEAAAEQDVGMTDETGELMPVTAQGDVLMLGSNLLEREVENTANEQLGFIDDLIVDQATGNVLFALVEHGGFLDLGEDWVAVPLTAMSLGPENDELILNVQEEVFEDYPDIGNLGTDWPVGLDETWDDDIDTFWRDAGYDTTVLEGVDPLNVVRADEMLDYDLNTFDANGLGSVEDMLVDLGAGEVSYVLVSFQDTTLYGQDWTAVPWQAFDPSMVADGQFTLGETFDTDLLINAPHVVDTDLTDAAVYDPTFDDEFDAFWRDAGFEIED
ncbi:MAG: PRC-barrel domain-containing protein [Anaerolineales bacterium]|nr:PRC-barrel domain-containing protein [Anaerolineales bacterium]